jgi:hypothetical protein
MCRSSLASPSSACHTIDSRARACPGSLAKRLRYANVCRSVCSSIGLFPGPLLTRVRTSAHGAGPEQQPARDVAALARAYTIVEIHARGQLAQAPSAPPCLQGPRHCSIILSGPRVCRRVSKLRPFALLARRLPVALGSEGSASGTLKCVGLLLLLNRSLSRVSFKFDTCAYLRRRLCGALSPFSLSKATSWRGCRWRFQC